MRSAATCRYGLIRNAECRMQNADSRISCFCILHSAFCIQMVSVLFPHFDHAAIEERFASWQARTRFRAGGADVVPYAPDDRACDVAGEVEATHVSVGTETPPL